MKVDLKLYRGYVNENHLVVFGHVFRSWAPDKYRLDRKGIRHAFSIIHMFRIRPLGNVKVKLVFHGTEVRTKTMEDGYFRFDIPFTNKLESGWHPYQVVCELEPFGIIEQGELLKPYRGRLGIISDIDDTFLISHSTSLFRKIYVMLLRNINKRKIYQDVVRHYQALSVAGQNSREASNSFFFVSSSEWNLYDFIQQFAGIHELPKAVIKLKRIKTGIRDFMFTGRGDHDHKFVKIKDIISFYPDLEYVLLGDDSQADPEIYEKICKVFPKNIRAVYIRQTGKNEKKKARKIMQNIDSLGVSTFYFNDSIQAISHSRQVGVI